MTRHLGVSASLSVLIVVFFAVVLYQPEGAAEPPSAPGGTATPSETEAARSDEPRPIPTADVPPAAVASRPPVARTLPVSHRSAPAEAPRTRSQGNPSAHPAQLPSASPPFEPVGTRRIAVTRSAFIHADAGENVTDVALRVYGSPDAAPALWMANRDILPDREARLSAATVLRTP